MKVRRGGICLLIIACVAGCHIDGRNGYLRIGPEFVPSSRPQLSIQRVVTESYRPKLPPTHVAPVKLERFPRSTVTAGATDYAMSSLIDTQSEASIIDGSGSFYGSSNGHGVHERGVCETCQSHCDRNAFSHPACGDSRTAELPVGLPTGNGMPFVETLPPPPLGVIRPPQPPAPAPPGRSSPSSTFPATENRAPPPPQPPGNEQATRPDLQAFHHLSSNLGVRLTEGRNTVQRHVTDASNLCQTLCRNCWAHRCELQGCVENICDEARLPLWMESPCEQCAERVGQLAEQVREHAPELPQLDWRHTAQERFEQARTKVGNMTERVKDADPFDYVRPPRLRSVNWSEVLDHTRSRIRLPSFSFPESQSNGPPPRKSDRWRDGWNGR